MNKVRAAGGVVVKNTHRQSSKVLLIKRRGFWDLPKGKIDQGESNGQAAIREVEEETGLKQISILNFLCETYHEYVERNQKIGKTTYWFSIACKNPESELIPQTEEEITEVRWVDLDEAISLVHFENLKQVLIKARELKNSAS